MITDISFDAGTIQPGETRFLTAWSDADYMAVEILCFREPPKPAKLRACSECGRFALASGEELAVTASLAVFEDGKGFLLIAISDGAGDKRELRVRVGTTEEEVAYA